jgi:outer membrane protein OmpA-like peptidoglycan-associated protein
MKSARRLQLLALAFAFGGAMAMAPSAHAQIATGFAINRHSPAERGSNWFSNESIDLRGRFRWAAGLTFDYAGRSLAAYNVDDSFRGSIVSSQSFLHIGGNVTFLDRFRVGLNIPFVVTNEGAPLVVSGVSYAAPSVRRVADMRLGVDMRLLGEYGDPLTVAFGTQVFLPTGSQESYTGDGSLRVQPRLLVAGDAGIFGYAARVGFESRPAQAGFPGGATGSEIAFGAAAGVKLLERKLTIGPEVSGSTVVVDDGAFKQISTPVEGMLGARYVSGVDLGVAAGAGLNRGIGSPTARLLVTIGVAQPYKKPIYDRDKDNVLDDVDACPDVPGIRSDDPRYNGCPDPDRDKDAILNAVDACPDEPGIKSDDPAYNGCPDPDRDRDGIRNVDDACPDVPGVKLENPRYSGCPDPDRDKDNIQNEQDACPELPGVASDDPKRNGCPDPDRDKDGVKNEEDACPEEAGKPDPDPAKNGCPKAFVKGDQIKITEQVRFVTGSAAIVKGPQSEEVLLAVVKTLTEHPDIKKVRVEGHTDNFGGAGYNRALSQARATAVMNWLVKKGIDRTRIYAKGLGLEKPLGDNKTEAGRKENRRVEFHIEATPPASPQTEETDNPYN